MFTKVIQTEITHQLQAFMKIDDLTFHLVPAAGQNIHLSSETSQLPLHALA